MLPPFGMAWTALMIRLLNTWFIWPASTSTGRQSRAIAYSGATEVPDRVKLADSLMMSAMVASFRTGAPPLEKVRS